MKRPADRPSVAILSQGAVVKKARVTPIQNSVPVILIWPDHQMQLWMPLNTTRCPSIVRRLLNSQQRRGVAR